MVNILRKNALDNDELRLKIGRAGRKPLKC